MTQLQFDDEGNDKPVRIGHANVEYRPTQSILTRATGFMADYDFTLNPYAGCSDSTKAVMGRLRDDRLLFWTPAARAAFHEARSLVGTDADPLRPVSTGD